MYKHRYDIRQAVALRLEAIAFIGVPIGWRPSLKDLKGAAEDLPAILHEIFMEVEFTTCL